jgi:hypothetical protein
MTGEYRARLEGMCSEPIKASDVTDKYLWSPGYAANIKIRRKTLKFKHLLKATTDGFELWDEGKFLRFKFPIDRGAVDLLEKDLAAEAPGDLRSGCENLDALKAALSQFRPVVRLIKMKKHRSRHLLTIDGIPVQLEIADILSPMEITSLALETNFFDQTEEERCLHYMREARDLLDLPGAFRIMGYMKFMDDLVRQGFC